MTARAHRILKTLAAIAMAGALSACAVYPAGYHHHGGGYYGRPYAYAQQPAYGGWRGGYYGGGYGYRGWR